ncbi:MAG TPA: LytTR family DNA-binding domain-containing protein [Bryobacteraceae bacterium]|nr:LytTR family DNA-binding domain-containing protein [Bryobacteraceae bacterium]
MIHAFVVDDEPLAVKRLLRMLEESGRVEIAGSSTDPIDALAALSERPVDVLFLDIQMPGMTGFEMLAYLDPQPLVVFTTAFDQYALQAFEVNSIDYLLKPIEPSHLSRALDKIERLRASPVPRPDWKALLAQLSEAVRQPALTAYPERIASRVGEKIQVVDLAKVTHFFAQDKLTYAATEGKNYVVDHAVGDLETRLDPRRFFRIHRATLLNLDWVREVDAWMGGRVLVRLKDAKGTQLQVARERAQELKKRLGL